MGSYNCDEVKMFCVSSFLLVHADFLQMIRVKGIVAGKNEVLEHVALPLLRSGEYTHHHLAALLTLLNMRREMLDEV